MCRLHIRRSNYGIILIRSCGVRGYYGKYRVHSHIHLFWLYFPSLQIVVRLIYCTSSKLYVYVVNFLVSMHFTLHTLYTHTPVYSKHLHQKQVLKILWRVKMVGIHFWVIKPIVTCCISIWFSTRFECVLVSINCQLLIQVEHMPTKMWSLWSRFLLFGPFRKKKSFFFFAPNVSINSRNTQWKVTNCDADLPTLDTL